MHRISHWSIPYFYRFFKSLLYFRKNRDKPWLTPDTNAFLEGWMRDSDIGFEWGSGRSTSWFARNTGKLTSVEHDPEWYTRVKSMLQKDNTAKKVSYKLIETSDKKYIQQINNVRDNSLDYCLVDGKLRDECALACIPKIKKGGLLIIDDIQIYFPDSINSRAPYARKREDGYETETWEKVGEKIKNWRHIRHSNGVKDTGIFLRY